MLQLTFFTKTPCNKFINSYITETVGKEESIDEMAARVCTYTLVRSKLTSCSPIG